MRRQRQAKIVATLGPATSSRDAITALFQAGADVFRLNMSHGSQEDHRKNYEILRELESRFSRPVGVLADLQGPKLRISTFVGGSIKLERGQEFRLDLDEAPGDTSRVGMPHPEIFAAIKEGHRVLLDDGRVVLEVTRSGEDFAETTVIAGERLSNNKGLNLPGVQLPIAALTDKDRADLDFALKLGADWIALSFVQRPQDIAEAHELVGGRAAVMAKLEKPSAIAELDEIVALADGIMVARGDLGVELKPDEVPGLQKRIIRACRRAGKPVIVATQMLESMITAPTPTRAEASDVATAVYDSADALMLSGETAVGEYASEAVAMMDRIMVAVEQDPLYEPTIALPEATSADAISAAARQVVETLQASAIVAYSVSGSTTLRAARERPEVPILGLTPKVESARRLALVWGVHSVVITAGVPFGTPGSTNTLRIARVY